MCAIEYMKISRRFFKIENKPQNTLLIEINIFFSYYLCNGSGATPRKSGGLAMLLALLWGVNLLWGGNLYGGNPRNLFLVDLPSGATELSAAIQRGPALQEPAPSRAILTCSDEVLARRGLSRDFRLRALL